MSSSGAEWYQDAEALLGEIRRGGHAPSARPRIAGYDDLREIRRGGQGIVYSARQRSTKRRVAIKVLRESAFATDTGRRRFEREIDVIAGLRHANIVTMHDSGVTEDGRHYFVMEYIDGAPLDQFASSADQETGTTRGRKKLLELFTKVCDAVHYAHLRGVIHRDLKPGNILVDAAGEPHVCDFGLAKWVTPTVTDESAAGDSVETAQSTMSVTGQFMGSLPWASPEQLDGAPSRIDARTDVYSLGVVLYQLLTGRLPFDAGGGIRQLFDHIARGNPPRPRTIDASLDDDLDTLVMKCLAADPERRYQSAAEVSGDLRRYLAGAPIMAKADSTWYTFRKTLRRYQVAAGAAGLVLVCLGVAWIVTWRSLGEATHARDAARQEASRREAIGAFLERMLTSVDPGRGERDVKFLEVIDRAALEIGDSLKNQPEVEWEIRRTLGATYSSLGLYAKAEAQYRTACQLSTRLHGELDRSTLSLRAQLPPLACQQGRLDEAEQEARAILEKIRQAFGATDRLTLRMMERLADVLNTRGRTDEAETMLRTAWNEQSRLLGPHHADTHATMNTLAVLLKQTGRVREAEDIYREILTFTPGETLPRDAGELTTLNNLALALQAQGKLDESEAMQRAALTARKQLLGDEHPDTLINMSNLATLLIERRKLDEAETLLREVVETESRTLGRDNLATLTAVNNLAKVLQDLGRLDEAESLYRTALEARRRVLGPDHAVTLMSEANLAGLHAARGRVEEAVEILQRVLSVRQRTLGEDHVETIVARNNVGMLLQRQGRLDEAASLFAAASRSAMATLPAEHYMNGLLRGNYGRCLAAQEKWHEAEEELKASCRILESVFGAPDPRTQKSMQSLVEVLERIGRPEDAVEWRRKLTTRPPIDSQ